MTVPASAQPDFRAAFRKAASSVWVVTTVLDGAPVGFTAISVASVSVAPPLVSFNTSRTSSSLPALLATRRYAAHLLAGDGEAVARRFAGPAADRFADRAGWRWGADGLPELLGTAARLGGAVASFTEAGDSLLVLGEVAAVTVGEAPPLVHHDRSYVSAVALPAAPPATQPTPAAPATPPRRHLEAVAR
ncbi:flavin reductase family protein [Kineococcus glutinatus]|uniref:Flavin reductase family protein n=1 Tax=Kineococcus glutinatus TaxID=1070872 RepID=A0ABP9HQU8_9ACTN